MIMKTISKSKIASLIIATLILSFSFTSVSFASTSTNLAMNFSIFNLLGGEEKSEVEVEVKKENVKQNIVVATTSETEVKNSCEYFDSTILNVLTLQDASEEAKQKIEKVEETIDDETSLRDSVLSSMKDLFGLQKKDKVIFREMKKDITSAKAYYSDLDEKILDTEVFLEESICEDTKVELAKDVDENTENLVVDEEIFRKQLAASLKEKMKILQDGLKNVKK